MPPPFNKRRGNKRGAVVHALPISELGPVWGILRDDAVEVVQPDDMRALFVHGYFGRGTISRRMPNSHVALAEAAGKWALEKARAKAERMQQQEQQTQAQQQLAGSKRAADEISKDEATTSSSSAEATIDSAAVQDKRPRTEESESLPSPPAEIGAAESNTADVAMDGRIASTEDASASPAELPAALEEEEEAAADEGASTSSDEEDDAIPAASDAEDAAAAAQLPVVSADAEIAKASATVASSTVSAANSSTPSGTEGASTTTTIDILSAQPAQSPVPSPSTTAAAAAPSAAASAAGGSKKPLSKRAAAAAAEAAMLASPHNLLGYAKLLYQRTSRAPAGWKRDAATGALSPLPAPAQAAVTSMAASAAAAAPPSTSSPAAAPPLTAEDVAEEEITQYEAGQPDHLSQALKAFERGIASAPLPEAFSAAAAVTSHGQDPLAFPAARSVAHYVSCPPPRTAQISIATLLRPQGRSGAGTSTGDVNADGSSSSCSGEPFIPASALPLGETSILEPEAALFLLESSGTSQLRMCIPGPDAGSQQQQQSANNISNSSSNSNSGLSDSKQALAGSLQHQRGALLRLLLGEQAMGPSPEACECCRMVTTTVDSDGSNSANSGIEQHSSSLPPRDASGRCIGCHPFYACPIGSPAMPLTARQLYLLCCARIPNFPARYAVYRHYRRVGWVVREGHGFGCDFVLYARGPGIDHSYHAITVMPLRLQIEQQPQPQPQSESTAAAGPENPASANVAGSSDVASGSSRRYIVRAPTALGGGGGVSTAGGGSNSISPSSAPSASSSASASALPDGLWSWTDAHALGRVIGGVKKSAVYAYVTATLPASALAERDAAEAAAAAAEAGTIEATAEEGKNLNAAHAAALPTRITSFLEASGGDSIGSCIDAAIGSGPVYPQWLARHLAQPECITGDVSRGGGPGPGLYQPDPVVYPGPHAFGQHYAGDISMAEGPSSSSPAAAEPRAGYLPAKVVALGAQRWMLHLEGARKGRMVISAVAALAADAAALEGDEEAGRMDFDSLRHARPSTKSAAAAASASSSAEGVPATDAAADGNSVKGGGKGEKGEKGKGKDNQQQKGGKKVEKPKKGGGEKKLTWQQQISVAKMEVKKKLLKLIASGVAGGGAAPATAAAASAGKASSRPVEPKTVVQSLVLTLDTCEDESSALGAASALVAAVTSAVAASAGGNWEADEAVPPLWPFPLQYQQQQLSIPDMSVGTTATLAGNCDIASASSSSPETETMGAEGDGGDAAVSDAVRNSSTDETRYGPLVTAALAALSSHSSPAVDAAESAAVLVGDSSSSSSFSSADPIPVEPEAESTAAAESAVAAVDSSASAAAPRASSASSLWLLDRRTWIRSLTPAIAVDAQASVERDASEVAAAGAAASSAAAAAAAAGEAAEGSVDEDAVDDSNAADIGGSGLAGNASAETAAPEAVEGGTGIPADELGVAMGES